MPHSQQKNHNNDGQKLADRIRKLLALAGNNPSEAEAAAAMGRASALMAEHNLTAVDVKTLGTEDERIEGEFAGQSARQTWARSIWHAVADLNFCFYSYQSPRPHGGFRRVPGKPGFLTNVPPHIGDLHHIIGTRANVTSTEVMALYLVQTVERLARECNEIHGVHEHHAFKLGCARRLTQRLRQLQSERLAAEKAWQTPAAGKNLPVLADLYRAHDEANRALYKYLHGCMPRGGASIGTTHVGAYERGKSAGNNIGLNTQVKSGRVLALPRR